MAGDPLLAAHCRVSGMRRARLPIAFAITAILAAQLAVAQRAVFVVRHAEKQIESNEATVPLSEAGRARAKKLAAVLKNAGVTAIYSTDTVRTLGTAEPLAQALKITVRKYSSAGPDGETDLRPLAERLKFEHARDVVLVVGHGDTVSPLLMALGCTEKIEIPSGQYDDLFAVVPGARGATLLRLTY
jgi:broad specificity phosphatase PhoE